MLPRVLSFALMVLLFGSVLGAQEPRPAPAGFCLDCGLLEGRPERCQGCEAPVVVDADVLMFYWIMSALGRGRPTRSFEERGLGNPLLGLERVDGSLDIERLASLIRGYRALEARLRERHETLTAERWPRLMGALPLRGVEGREAARARRLDQRAASALLEEVARAQAVFRAGASGRFGSLAELDAAGLITGGLARGRFGFRFTSGAAAAAPGEHYFVYAEPLEAGRGPRLYLDRSGVLRVHDGVGSAPSLERWRAPEGFRRAAAPEGR